MVWYTYYLYFGVLLELFYSASLVDQLNDFSFERAELKVFPDTGFKIPKFVAKKLNRTVMDFDAQVSLNRTYQTMFVHAVAYRQFSSNEYRKFLLDVWEDICEVAEDRMGNVFLKIVKQVFNGHTNLFRGCPFIPGIYFITMKEVHINVLNFGQILPSGRYRLEVTFTDGFQGRNLIFYKFYFGISDRRLEQF